MALYFHFNETTGDLVYSDKAAYDAEGYASLGEQTNMSPFSTVDWVFDSKRSNIKTVSKDPAATEKISGLTSMNKMFQACFDLTSIDLSGFDTSQVTGMNSMFGVCDHLISLDLSGFDTSQVTDMNGMFQGCSSLTSLDLSGFDTSLVENMGSMFKNCYSLKFLDISGFDTSHVISVDGMFNEYSLDIVRCRPLQFVPKPI